MNEEAEMHAKHATRAKTFCNSQGIVTKSALRDFEVLRDQADPGAIIVLSVFQRLYELHSLLVPHKGRAQRGAAQETLALTDQVAKEYKGVYLTISTIWSGEEDAGNFALTNDLAVVTKAIKSKLERLKELVKKGSAHTSPSHRRASLEDEISFQNNELKLFIKNLPPPNRFIIPAPAKVVVATKDEHPFAPVGQPAESPGIVDMVKQAFTACTPSATQIAVSEQKLSDDNNDVVVKADANANANEPSVLGSSKEEDNTIGLNDSPTSSHPKNEPARPPTPPKSKTLESPPSASSSAPKALSKDIALSVTDSTGSDTDESPQPTHLESASSKVFMKTKTKTKTKATPENSKEKKKGGVMRNLFSRKKNKGRSDRKKLPGGSRTSSKSPVKKPKSPVDKVITIDKPRKGGGEVPEDMLSAAAD
ncbi:hypothetical protein TrLO_g3768 [Triparma laevis f. longispina]|uniref:Uncharacterized protein n=1 Tax=Triparma laevis f. longispina TaxID=1714387 RepID=A0A9W7FPV5_9STRA|nr:hypothetical protein TrLO_g3768 [Triparma laevis f. longispina]